MGSSQVKEQAKECSSRTYVQHIDAQLLQIDEIVEKFCDDCTDSLRATFKLTNIQGNAPMPEFSKSANLKMSTDDTIAGFTTSEHAMKLLSDASHEKFFKVHTDFHTQCYTHLQNSKFQLLYTIYMNRQAGDGSQQGFFEYVDQFFETNDTPSKSRGQVAINTSLRFSLSLLKELRQVSPQLLENALSHLYAALADAPAKSLYELDVQAFQQDTTLDEARDFLAGLVKERSLDSIVELSLRIIIRLGIVRANPEDLLTACNLIYSLPDKPVDLRNEIASLLPKKGNAAEVNLHERKGIINANLMSMFNHKQDAIATNTEIDGWCTDGKSFYTTYDKLKKYHVPIDRTDMIYLENVNDEFETSLSSKGQICYLNGKLYLRNPNKTDNILLVFDAETLKFDKEATEAIKPSEEKDALTMAIMEEADKVTGRKLSASPFFTDGQFFYVVSQKKHIRQAEEDEDAPSLPTAIVVEKFCPKQFTHLKSTVLMKNEHETYHDKKSTDLDNYLVSCSFATNGRYLLISKNQKRMLFDMTSGLRICKQNNGTCSLVIHDYLGDKFYTFNKQNDYYFVQDFSIQALNQQQISQQSQVELANHQLPIDTIKDAYLKGFKPSVKINAIQRKIKKQPAAELQVNNETVNSGSLVVALLLNEIQSNCDEFNSVYKSLEAEKHTSDNYLKFFHWPGATYITSSLFEQIKDLLRHLQYLIDGPKKAENIADQLSFSNIIKILATNFRAMSYCGLKLADILEPESQTSFVQEFHKSITYIIENGFSKQDLDENTCGRLWDDLYATCQDIMKFSIQLVQQDPQSVISNLAVQLGDKSMSAKKAESCAYSLQFLSESSQIPKLFNIEAQNQIKDVQSIIVSLQQVQTAKLLQSVQAQKLFESLPQKSDVTLFNQACDLFERQIYEQILVQLENANQQLQKKQENNPAGKLQKQKNQDWFDLLCSLAANCFELLCSRQATCFEAVLSHYSATLESKTNDFWTEETKSGLKSYQRQICNLLTIPKQLHLLNTYITALAPLCGDQPQIYSIVSEAAIALVRIITKLQVFLEELTKGEDSFDKQQSLQLTQLERRLVFFVGSVAYNLVQIKSDRLTSEQLKEETATQKMARMLLDSKVLSGGIELRYLNQFAKETINKMKHVLHHSPESLSILEKEEEPSKEDQLLAQVLKPDQNKTVELLFKLLQAHLEHPMSRCQYAKVGSEQGMTMSRVAFTVMLKFSHLQDTFEQCLMETEILESQFEDVKEILAEIKQDESFVAVSKLWQEASKIRIWIVEKKNNLSEKIDKTQRAQFIQAKKGAQKEGEEEQEYKLTEEDKQEIQRLVFEQLDKELSDIFVKITQKAEYLLKMQVPTTLKYTEEQDAFLSRVPSYLAGEQEKQQKLLAQMDWQERLKSWKQANLVKPKETQAGNTSVLACLLTPISVQKIQARVESHSLLASRRACGLFSIAQLLQLPIQSECVTDLTNWFCASIRNRTNKLAHYIDDIESCGNHFQSLVKQQFFKILQSVISAINKARTEAEVIRLLDALQWKFLGRDHADLVECDIFKCLRQGDGSVNHPIRLAWGKKNGYITWHIEDVPTSLPYVLIQTFDHLFLNIVSRIVNNNGDQIQLKKTGTAIPLIERSKSVINSTVSEQLIGDAFNILFGELNRYVNQLREFGGVDYLAFSTLFNKIKVNNLKNDSYDVIGDEYQDLNLFDIEKELKEKAEQEAKEAKEKEEREAAAAEEKEAAATQDAPTEDTKEVEPDIAPTEETKEVEPDKESNSEQQVEVDDVMPELIEENKEESVKQEDTLDDNAERDEAKEEKALALKTEQMEKEQAALTQIETQINDFEQLQAKSLHQLYSGRFLKRLLRLLEVFTNVAQTQQSALIMIRRVANPYMLLILINLFRVSEPGNQVMVLKIMQQLINMGTPAEVFEAAIQSVNKQDCAKQLFHSEFLQFWGSYLFETREAIYNEKHVASRGSYEVTQEIAKLIQCIQLSGHYRDWSEQIYKTLTSQCLQLQSLSLTERDVLFCLLPGADFQRVSVGTLAVTEDNQLLTVLGFRENKEDEVVLGLENTFTNCNQVLVGLYYNKNTKDQQEVIEIPPHTVKPLVSFDKTDNGVVRQPQVLSLFVNLLVSEDVGLQVQILKVLTHLFEQSDFLQQLKDLNLLEPILLFLFKPRSQQKSVVPSSWLEQKITNMKVYASEQLKSLVPSTSMKCKVMQQKQLIFTHEDNGTTIAQNAILLSSINLNRTHDKTSYFVNFDLKIQKQVCKQYASFIGAEKLLQFDQESFDVMRASEAIVTHDLDVKQFVLQLAQKAKEYTDAENKADLIDWSLVFATVIFVVKKSSYDQVKTSVSLDFFQEHNLPKPDKEESLEALRKELAEWAGVDLDVLMYHICTLPEQTISAVRTALPKMLLQIEEENKNRQEVLQRLQDDGNQSKLLQEEEKLRQQREDRLKKVQEVLPTVFKSIQKQETTEAVKEITNECELYDLMNCKKEELDNIKMTIQKQFVENVQVQESVKQKSEAAKSKLYLKSITEFSKINLPTEFQETSRKLLVEQVNQTLIEILHGSDLAVIAPIIFRNQRKQLSQFLKQCFNSAYLTYTSTGDKIALTHVKKLLSKLFKFCLHSDDSEFLLEFIKVEIIESAIRTCRRLESQKSGSITKNFSSEQDLHPFLLYQIIKLILENRVPSVIASKSFLPTLMQLALGMFVLFWDSSEPAVPMKLLTVCQNIIFFCEENLEQFVQNGVIHKILSADLLTQFVGCIDYMESSFSEVQRLLLEVYLSVINLKDLAEKHTNSKFETNIQMTEGISQAKRALRIVREKTDFKLLKYLIHKSNNESKVQTLNIQSNHPHYDVRVKAQFQMQEVERIKFKGNDKSEFKPFTFVGISPTGDGKNVNLYPIEEFKDKLFYWNSANFFVYYPVKRQMIISMGENKRDRMTNQSGKDAPYSIKETQDLNAVKISCSRNSSFILTENSQLYQCGQKFGSSSGSFQLVKMPKNQIPDKIYCGRNCKFVIDKEGKTFYLGESEEFELPNNANTSSFKEFKLTSDEFNPEKIVDIACGYRYNLFVTDKGKLWATGRKFLKRVGLESQAPIQINLPQQPDEQLTCIRVWASQRKEEQMALIMVQTEKGETQLWSAGKNESGCLGQGGKIKESKRFCRLAYDSSAITFGEVSFFDDHAMAIDQNGKLWAWGNNQRGRAGLAEDFECVYQPTRVTEFDEMNLTAVKVSCGRNHALVLAVDSNGSTRLYSVGKDEQNFKVLGCSQQQAVESAIRKIPSLSDIEIVDFCASTEYNMVIMKGDKLTSDNFQEHKLPDGQIVYGVLHVYQKEDKWHYMSEKEYRETKGDQLPDVCIAFKYPISNMDSFFNGSKAIIQTNLQTLVGEQTNQTTSSYSEKVIDGILYTASTKIDGDELLVNLSETEFLNVTSQFDVHPLLYYRLAKPLQDGAKLPTIDLKAIYGQTNKFGFDFEVTPDLSYVENTRFLEKTAEQYKEYNELVSRFPVEGDRELFTQMDKQLKVLAGAIELAGTSNFVLADMTFKDENEEGRLSKVPSVVKQKRIELLWQYNYYFCQLQKYLVSKRNKGFKGQVAENTSAANIFSQVKHLILGAVKMNFVDAAIDKLPTGGEQRKVINRNDALRFEESGKVDHTGEFTVFGQIFKQLGGNYDCWRQNKPDDQALRIDFDGESSIDAGGPYREVLTNFVRELECGVLPLIVKTTNNKTNHGDYRDCYIVNPDSVTPTHQQMFKFLGVLFGYAFRSKSCLPFNMAPLFWKQLIDETPTEADLKTTDTYTWQTFQTLRKNAKKIKNTAEFEAIVDQNFTYVVNGKEVELCQGGKERMVNLENMEEFISLMCEKKFSEGSQQIKWIIEGMNLIIPRHIIGIVQWSDVEDRIAGQKIVDVAKLKSITQYRYCDENSKVIKMFWAVMERMADEDKTAYLKFVWGRSRMPYDCSTLRYNHRIALIDEWDKEQLPESHTCFFAIDIPNYESEEILEKKLLTSIRFCGEIDND